MLVKTANIENLTQKHNYTHLLQILKMYKRPRIDNQQSKSIYQETSLWWRVTWFWLYTVQGKKILVKQIVAFWFCIQLN